MVPGNRQDGRTSCKIVHPMSSVSARDQKRAVEDESTTYSTMDRDFAELPMGQYLLVLMDDYSRFPIVESYHQPQPALSSLDWTKCFLSMAHPMYFERTTDRLSTVVTLPTLRKILVFDIGRSHHIGHAQTLKSKDS